MLRAGNAIEKVSKVIVVLLFSEMLIAALVGVIARYVLQSPFQWTEEVARYSLIWMGFLSINIALWQGKHINVNLLLKRFPPKLAKLTTLINDTLIMFYLVVVLYYGWAMTSETLVTTQSFQISMFWFYLAVPVSAALTIVQLIFIVTRKLILPSEILKREL